MGLRASLGLGLCTEESYPQDIAKQTCHRPPRFLSLAGKWTVQQAAELSVAAPTMASALDARYMSALRPERLAAHKVS